MKKEGISSMGNLFVLLVQLTVSPYRLSTSRTFKQSTRRWRRIMQNLCKHKLLLFLCGEEVCSYNRNISTVINVFNHKSIFEKSDFSIFQKTRHNFECVLKGSYTCLFYVRAKKKGCVFRISRQNKLRSVGR